MSTESGRHSQPSNNPNTGPNTGPDLKIGPSPRAPGSTGTTLPGTGYKPIPDSEDPIIGRELSSYRIIKRLGQGGMGVVYLGQHTMIGRKAAVKVLKPELCKDQEVVERFYQEGRTVSQLAHENIIDVYDFGKTEEGQVYFIMELLEGENLAERIKRGKVPFVEAYAIIMQTGEALAAAHEKGITHRDIKPDNIFLIPKPGAPPKVKVLDFGLAKLGQKNPAATAERRTQAGSIMGTPHYMSPQQIDGGDVDGRADIYSLGAVIYEMFTGGPPFKGTTVGELLKGHLFLPPPPLRAEPELQVPSKMEPLVAKALAKRLEERYSNVKALLEDLKLAAQDNKLVPPPGVGAPGKSRAWLWALLGGGTAAAAAAAYLFLINPTKPVEPTSIPLASAPIVMQKVDNEALRDKALQTLREALQEREAEIRADGAKGVGKIQDKGSAEALMKLLADPELVVRQSAALSLADLNDASAIAPLQEAQKAAAEPGFAEALDHALYRLGSAEAEARLLEKLAQKETSAKISAALILASQGELSSEKVLQEALAEPNEEISKRTPEILDSLLRLGDEGAQSKLAALLKSPEEPVRLAAAEVLASAGDDSGREAAQQSLADKNSPQRLNAARVLVLLGDYSGYDVFTTALKDKSPEVQKAGLEGLGLLAEQSALPTLAPYLEKEIPATVRVAASVAILEIVGLSPELLAKSSKEALAAALASNDAETRAKAASALGSADEKEALPFLQNALKDKEAKVRKEAADALGRLGNKDAVADLAAAVKDEDPQVAAAAADALSRLGGQDATDALKQAKGGEAALVAAGTLAAQGDKDALKEIQKGAASKDAKIGAAAIKAASKANANDVLKKALKDKDANVRLQAAKALAQKGDSAGQKILEEAATGKDAAAALEAKNALASLGVAAGPEGFSWPGAADKETKKQVVASTKDLEAKEAKKLLSRALHDADADIRNTAVAAIAELEAKDPEGAKKLYRAAARDKDPTVSAAAKAALARLETQGPKSAALSAAPTTNNPASTVSVPLTPEEQKKQEFSLLMSTAEVALSGGRYAEAINRLKKAQDIKSDNRIYFELGEAYRKWGDQSNNNPKEQISRWKLAKSNYERFIKGGGKGGNLAKSKRAIEDIDFNLSAAGQK